MKALLLLLCLSPTIAMASVSLEATARAVYVDDVYVVLQTGSSTIKLPRNQRRGKLVVSKGETVRVIESDTGTVLEIAR